jgi:hypothetical protein
MNYEYGCLPRICHCGHRALARRVNEGQYGGLGLVDDDNLKGYV